MVCLGNQNPTIDTERALLKSTVVNHLAANRGDLAYQNLKAQLLSGAFSPGSTLSTYHLAAELGISRTPISQALKRLEDEGFVEIIPQVGCRVVQPTPARVVEVFVLRAVLEGLAAEIAAQRITAPDIQAFEHILQAGEAAIRQNDSGAYSLINKQFHTLIVTICGMTTLEELLDKFTDFSRYCMVNHPFFSQARMAISSQEHRAIVDALMTRDSVKARRLLEIHLRQTGEAFSCFLAEQQS